MLNKKGIIVLISIIFFGVGYGLAGGDEDSPLNTYSIGASGFPANPYDYTKPTELINLKFFQEQGRLRFNWTRSSSKYFAYYKLVFSETNPNPVYDKDDLISAIDEISNTSTLVDNFEGYRRLCVIYEGFYDAPNKSDYRNCSNVVHFINEQKIPKSEKELCEASGRERKDNKCLSLVKEKNECEAEGKIYAVGKCIDSQNGDKQERVYPQKIINLNSKLISSNYSDNIVSSIEQEGMFDEIVEYDLYKFFKISSPESLEDLRNKLNKLSDEDLKLIKNTILPIIIDLLNVKEGLYFQIQEEYEDPDMGDINEMKFDINQISDYISTNLKNLYDHTNIYDEKHFENKMKKLKVDDEKKIEEYIIDNNLKSEDILVSDNESIDDILADGSFLTDANFDKISDSEVVKIKNKERVMMYKIDNNEINIVESSNDYYLFNNTKSDEFRNINTNSLIYIPDQKIFMVLANTQDGQTKLVFYDKDNSRIAESNDKINFKSIKRDENLIYLDYEQGDKVYKRVLVLDPIKKPKNNNLQANILGGNIGMTLLVVLISVITVVVVMFIMSHFKKKKKGLPINLDDEVKVIQKKQQNIKSQKIYLDKLINIYKNILDLGYTVSPIFLKNFIISMKTRGFLILLGGNGVGKTAFVENFIKGTYGDKYQKYYQKVIIKSDMDDEKKFLGLYDRLNNNYIDPYGITQLIANAYWDRENPYIILLDEINMQDIEKYFPYFMDTDKILNERQSDFIKVGELSEADSKELKQSKLNLIKQYNFVIQREERIYEFGYRIPDNVYIVGTANVDKAVEPFTGKVLDRADVIKVKYMGDKDYKDEEYYIQDRSINLLREKEWLSKDSLDEKVLEYVKEVCEIMSLSKRTDKSLCYYVLSTRDHTKLGISQAIKQKVLTKAYGPEYKGKLEKFIEISERYKDDLKLQDAIDEVNEMLKDDFVNFWKLT